MPITERGLWTNGVIDERGHRVFGRLTETGQSAPYIVRYLSMNGIGDYLQLPYFDFNEVTFDVSIERGSASGYLLDARSNGTTSGYFIDDPVTDTISSDWTTVEVNGVSKLGSSTILPNKTRATLHLVGAYKSAYAVLNSSTFIARGRLDSPLKVAIYSVKFYNAGALVAHYDMSTGTVQDQSGNGNHATLTGGTWVTDNKAIAIDSFNRADSTNTLGRADTGQAWTDIAGTWGILNNQAYCSGSGNPVYTLTDTGYSDVSITVRVTTFNDTVACVFRADPASNSFLMFHGTGKTFQSYSSGAYTTLKSAGGNISSGDVIRVTAHGSTLTAYVNGVQVVQTTSTLNQTSTKHGLGNWRTSLSTGANGQWDNFRVDPLVSMSATSTTVSSDSGKLNKPLYYLSMNGAGDYLRTPTITFDKVVLDMKSRAANDSIYFDARNGVALSYFQKTGSGADNWGTGIGSVKVNGVTATNSTVFMPYNTRATVEINLASAGTDDINIFSGSSATAFTSGELYSIKIYNGSTLQAHYDLTSGTLKDQTGLNSNITLTGGTWVSDKAYVSDSFNRADSTTTLGISDTGKAWQTTATFGGSTWGISGNTPYTPASTQGAKAYVDSGQSDNIKISLDIAGNQAQAGLLFRYTSEAVHFFVAKRSPTGFNINRSIGGGDNVFVGSGGTVAYTSSAKASIELNGSTIKLYENDILVGTFTDTNGTTGTKHGMVSSFNTGLNLDNFRVEPILSIAATSTTVSSDTGALKTPSGVTLVSDSFNRSNNNTTLGTTDSFNGGTTKTWQVEFSSSRTWGISNNRAYAVTSNGAVAYIDAGVSNGVVKAMIGTYTTGMALVFRRLSDSEYIELAATSTAYVLRRFNLDEGTVVMGTYTQTPTAGDIIGVSLNGTSITAIINGVSKTPVTMARDQTNTQYGLRVADSTANWDYFELDSLPGAVPLAATSTTSSSDSGTLTTTASGGSVPLAAVDTTASTEVSTALRKAIPMASTDTTSSTDRGTLTKKVAVTATSTTVSTEVSTALRKAIPIGATDTTASTDSGSLTVIKSPVQLAATSTTVSSETSTRLRKAIPIASTDTTSSTDRGTLTKKVAIGATDTTLSTDTGTLRKSIPIASTDLTASTDRGTLTKKVTIASTDTTVSTTDGGTLTTGRLPVTFAAVSTTASTDRGTVWLKTGLASVDVTSSTDRGTLYKKTLMSGASTTLSSDSVTLRKLVPIAGTSATLSTDSATLQKLGTLASVSTTTTSDRGTLVKRVDFIGTSTTVSSEKAPVLRKSMQMNSVSQTTTGDTAKLWMKWNIKAVSTTQSADTGAMRIAIRLPGAIDITHTSEVATLITAQIQADRLFVRGTFDQRVLRRGLYERKVIVRGEM